MARIGKCRKCKNGWVSLGSYACWKQKCDGIGYCKECMTEHRLEMRGTSNNYSIMKDWEIKGEFYSQTKTSTENGK